VKRRFSTKRLSQLRLHRAVPTNKS